MKMLQIITVFVLLMLFPLAVAAQEQPPSLENHQFYGVVSWDNAAKEPAEVMAKVSGKTFTSIIKKEYCGDKTCTGSYGKDADNILRVQGQAGQAIQFLIGAVQVGSAVYKPWEATELNFNMATFAVEKPGCVADWKCSAWSKCASGKETRTCVDQNKCDADKLKKTEEQSCGAAAAKVPATTDLVCAYDWECTDWSSCVSSAKTRTCSRVDDCDAQFASGAVASVVHYPKPAEKEFCIGAILPAKEAAPSAELPPVKEMAKEAGEAVGGAKGEGVSVWLYVGIAMIVVVLGGILYLLTRKKETQIQ